MLLNKLEILNTIMRVEMTMMAMYMMLFMMMVMMLVVKMMTMLMTSKKVEDDEADEALHRMRTQLGLYYPQV